MTDLLQSSIRCIPDFPKPGIVFRDITTLLKDPRCLAASLDLFEKHYAHTPIDVVAGIESRGFILGAALACRLGAGFVPIRKPGKLPATVAREEYTLEYGTDAIEIHKDAITPGARVLLHDDLLATGGTIGAACRLVKGLGGQIVGLSFLIELSFLGARKKLCDAEIYSLVQYDSE